MPASIYSYLQHFYENRAIACHGCQSSWWIWNSVRMCDRVRPCSRRRGAIFGDLWRSPSAEQTVSPESKARCYRSGAALRGATMGTYRPCKRMWRLVLLVQGGMPLALVLMYEIGWSPRLGSITVLRHAKALIQKGFCCWRIGSVPRCVPHSARFDTSDEGHDTCSQIIVSIVGGSTTRVGQAHLYLLFENGRWVNLFRGLICQRGAFKNECAYFPGRCLNLEGNWNGSAAGLHHLGVRPLASRCFAALPTPRALSRSKGVC